MALLLMHSPRQNMMINGLRDLPVKVAHKIGDAYDFRHDVAIVYTNSPYVIAILQIIRIMIRFPTFQKISMRY